MLNVYLPVAQISVSIISLAAVGFASGFLSGLYGIGGAIVAVPLMVMSGIPINIALATSSLQILGISAVNVIRNSFTGDIRYLIGLKIGVFSILGSMFGAYIFSITQNHKLFQPTIYLMYVCLMGIMSVFIIIDSVLNHFSGVSKKTYSSANSSNKAKYKDERWRARVQEFDDYMKAVGIDYDNKLPFRGFLLKSLRATRMGMISFLIGMLSGIMGIGGGFMFLPFLIYTLKESMKVASVTSSFIVLITVLPTCMLQLSNTQWVDPIIALISGFFAAVAIRIGNNVAKLISPEILKIALGIILLLVAVKFGTELFVVPRNPYAIYVL